MSMLQTADGVGDDVAQQRSHSAANTTPSEDRVRHGGRTGRDAAHHAGPRVRDLAGDAYTKGDRAVRSFGRWIAAPQPNAAVLGAGAIACGLRSVLRSFKRSRH